MAPATVASVLTEANQSEIDEVERTILELEQAIKDAGGLDEEQDTALESLAEMDLRKSHQVDTLDWSLKGRANHGPSWRLPEE